MTEYEKEIRKGLTKGQYVIQGDCSGEIDHLLSIIDNLRTELDEIREAWKPIGYSLDFSNEEDYECLDLSAFADSVKFGDLRKLAKLIREEKP